MKTLLRLFALATLLHSSISLSMPITDTVTIEGREWAQIDLFLALTWNEVNAVCPLANDGVCADNQLAGWDMAGWLWASIDDANALFNYFLSESGVTGEDLLSGPDSFTASGSSSATWSDAFFAAGFRPNILASGQRRIASGRVQNRFNGVSPHIAAISENSSFDTSFNFSSTASTDFAFGGLDTRRPLGVWIYRPAASVPTSSTFLLLGLALIGLRFRT